MSPLSVRRERPVEDSLYSQAGGRSYAPSTTYNPGYQETGGQGGRRYLSEGELLGEGGHTAQGVGPSTSAGQLQVSEVA